MRLAVFAFAAVTCVSIAHAQLLYSTGFEEPVWVTNSPVATVDGWFTGWNAAHRGLIQTGVVSSGDQSAQFTRSRQDGFDYGVARTIGFNSGASSNKVVSLEWDMRLGQAGTRSSFWGAGLWDGPSASRLNFGADNLGNVVIGNPNAFVLTGATVSFNQWNTYRLDFDMATFTANAFLNGNQVASNIAMSGTNRVFEFITLYAQNNPAGNANDTTYYDNVRVTAVPEPATMLVLGAGLAALAARRRQRRAR